MKQFNYLVVAALVALTLSSCGKKSENATQTEAERVEKVRVQTLNKMEIMRKVNLSAILQGYETQNVAPSVTGKIEHIFVEEGDRVAAGSMLVRMDQMQYNTAKLTYANLGVELARTETLLKSGSATQQAYDQLKLSYDQTKENIDFLESNTFVKAPFAGVISAKNYEDGELYGGQPILVLTQVSTLKAEVAVPERYFPMVKAGMEVIVNSEIYPGREFNAIVERVFPTVDPASHTFIVKVKIPNAKEELRPGMYTSTTLALGEEDVVMAPYQAVLKLQGSNDRYVFINENGRAKRVPVTTGQRVDDKIEIISDEITENSQLVVYGQGRLVDGVKLDIVK